MCNIVLGTCRGYVQATVLLPELGYACMMLWYLSAVPCVLCLLPSQYQCLLAGQGVLKKILGIGITIWKEK